MDFSLFANRGDVQISDNPGKSFVTVHVKVGRFGRRKFIRISKSDKPSLRALVTVLDTLIALAAAELRAKEGITP